MPAGYILATRIQSKLCALALPSSRAEVILSELSPQRADKSSDEKDGADPVNKSEFQLLKRLRECCFALAFRNMMLILCALPHPSHRRKRWSGNSELIDRNRS